MGWKQLLCGETQVTTQLDSIEKRLRTFLTTVPLGVTEAVPSAEHSFAGRLWSERVAPSTGITDYFPGPKLEWPYFHFVSFGSKISN